MMYDPEKHHRHSIRLKGYDYAQAGTYFVTLCTQNRACLFGEVVDGEVRLNEAGHMAAEEWNALPNRFPGVVLDGHIIMPNHVHGILVISRHAHPDGTTTQATTRGATTRVAPTLGDVVGAFKSRVTLEYARGVKTNRWPPFRERLWQRNYYEHIINDEESLNRIRRYIADNPGRWAFDRENPFAIMPDPGDSRSDDI